MGFLSISSAEADESPGGQSEGRGDKEEKNLENF